jgi:hypothetical protein
MRCWYLNLSHLPWWWYYNEVTSLVWINFKEKKKLCLFTWYNCVFTHFLCRNIKFRNYFFQIATADVYEEFLIYTIKNCSEQLLNFISNSNGPVVVFQTSGGTGDLFQEYSSPSPPMDSNQLTQSPPLVTTLKTRQSVPPQISSPSSSSMSSLDLSPSASSKFSCCNHIS